MGIPLYLLSGPDIMIEYRKTTLANGLKVVTVEMPHLHSAEMACYLRAGSRDEPAALAGISHFLEHMIFRGTADYPTSLELEHAFEAAGGAVNASTDTEITCFHSRLHPEHIAAGARLFASMLRRPLFNELEIERRIILEEALEDLNEAGEEVSPDNLTARLLWPQHALSLPTVGTRDTIGRIGREDLAAYHGRYYTPANTVVTVAGRVRHAEVLAVVEPFFTDWNGAAPPPPAPWSPEGTPATPRLAWVRDSDSQVTLQLAFRMPGRHDRHSVPLRVLRRLLSWGATSRLMLQLREKLGLTYSVEANLSLFDECGCFTVDLAVTPANLTRAVRETLAVLTDLRRRPVGEAELERTVRSYLYDLDFSRDHAEEMAARYGWGDLVGYLRTLEADRREIAALTPAALHQAVRELFLPDALKGAFVGPFRDRDRTAVEKLAGEWEG